MARSFGLKVFEAESIEDLTAEQYGVLVAVLNESIQAVADKDAGRTVSIRTRP